VWFTDEFKCCTADQHEVREVGALSTTAREQAYDFEQPNE